MTGAVVGRDAVLDQAWTVLRGSGTVLLEGAAGIGKTTVLRALVERAQTSGMVVLACGPTEIEQQLPLAAVADVLRPLDRRIDLLPDPQRDAARAALAASTDPVDELALGAALRALVDEAAAETSAGLLLVVDDAPWLDPPSERALRFLVRRVAGRVAVLTSCRVTDSGPGPVPLGLDEAAVTRFRLAPLGLGPLHHLLTGRFDVPLPRPLLGRLAQESGGNPLLAIEMLRAILRQPAQPRPGDDLPVAGSLQALVDDTLTALPDESQLAVRLAALLTSPTVDTLADAGVADEALDPAEGAGLVRVEDSGAVRFVHPVHAAAVRAALGSGLRRRLHRRLADACTDPDERARQLARCTTAADAAVADELAAAARRARDRGASEVAMDLYDRAAALTPADEPDVLHQRRLAAVRCRFDTGDYTVAGEQARALADELDGDARAEALLLRAEITWSADDVVGAREAAESALAVAGHSSRLAGRIHAHLASFKDELPDEAIVHARAALELLEQGSSAPGSLVTDDRDFLVAAHFLLFFAEVRSGRPARPELLERALELEGAEPSRLAGTVPAIWWKGVDDHTRARARLSTLLERAVAIGDEPFQHEVICHLGETEVLAGRYADADRWITEATELGRQLSSGLASETWLRGMLEAHRGDLDTAAAVADEGLAEATRTGDAWRRRINLHLAGLTALAAGRHADAVSRFAELAGAVDQTGLVEPLGTRFEADWIEACVADGDLDTARSALDRLERRHSRLPRPWTTLGLARARVLMAAAEGRAVDDAISDLETARAAVPPDVTPLDRARCLLVVGVAHRRARRKKPARDALELAAVEFDALGARSLAARAREEIARIGGRAPTPFALTETEERVARLAADGRTNRAIADALFVSTKTVEANLARAYRKLGIARRGELAAALQRDPVAET
jgi:DNA-binding CsgD family transcriptional regulator